MDISLSCDTPGCRNSIGTGDRVYCASCRDSFAEENESLIKERDAAEEERDSLESALDDALDENEELRAIIRSCATCSAVLVVKKL